MSERPPSPFSAPPAAETVSAWTPQRGLDQLDAGDLKGAADGFLSAILGRPADAVTEPLPKSRIPLGKKTAEQTPRNAASDLARSVILFYRGGDADGLRGMIRTRYEIPDPEQQAEEAQRREVREAHERSLEEERRRDPLSWRPETTDPELFEEAMIQHFVVANPEIPAAEKGWIIQKLKKRGTFRDPKVPLSQISFEPNAPYGPTLVIRHRMLETFREGHGW